MLKWQQKRLHGCLCPQVDPGNKITICPSFVGKNYEIWSFNTVNKWWYIPLYVVCKGITLHILLMPCLVTWLRQLTWFIARFPTLLKNNLWLSDNGPIIPFMQKRSMYKRGCELQIQSQSVLALLWSNNVIHHFSSNSSTRPRHGKESHRGLVSRCLHIHMCNLRGCMITIRCFFFLCCLIPLHLLQ